MKYNSNKLLKSFKKNGYVIVPNMINPNFHKKLFKMFYDLALSVIHRNKLKYKNIKNIEKLNILKILKFWMIFYYLF